jgi:glutamate carboxypeptidase
MKSSSLPFDKNAMIDGISKWVNIESPTTDVAGVEAMLDLVVQEFAGLPVKITRTPPVNGFGGMVQVDYGFEKNTKGILVLSHLDTVHPLGTLETRLPLRIEGDKFFGPGLLDMKGGAYIALEAFRSLLKAGIKPQLPVTFLFTPDEEVGSPTSRSKIEELARKAAFALITEPCRAGGKCVTARKGVGRYVMKVTGRPAHSGAWHQDGRSAINELARQITAIEAMTDYTRGITTTVGLISGGTAANVVPEFASCEIDLRVPNVEIAREMEAKILALTPQTPDCVLEISGAMNRPPFSKTKLEEGLFEKAQAVGQHLGFTLEDVPMTGGGSDANFTAALGVPSLDGLGIEGAGAHTLSEYGLISSLERQTRLMAGLLETLA